MLSLKFLNAVLKRRRKTLVVPCPACFGKKTTVLYRRPDRQPDPLDLIAACPICKGTGSVPETVKKEGP